MVKDLITVFKLVENNLTWNQEARRIGADLLHTKERFAPGSADEIAFYSGPNSSDCQLEAELRRAYPTKQPEHLLESYLNRHYTVHPETPEELGSRVFTFVRQDMVDTFVLDTRSSIQLSLDSFCRALTVYQAETYRGNISHYEGILDAEKELGNNPDVLMDIVALCLPKSTNSLTYIWYVPRTE
ncbi:hypothetical protein J4232_04050 [Candidatus Woesearchaeota archaeon]|nr:hypothetical protein [Candidatus Woesearchaeota archaeon]